MDHPYVVIIYEYLYLSPFEKFQPHCINIKIRSKRDGSTWIEATIFTHVVVHNPGRIWTKHLKTYELKKDKQKTVCASTSLINGTKQKRITWNNGIVGCAALIECEATRHTKIRFSNFALRFIYFFTVEHWLSFALIKCQQTREFYCLHSIFA